MNISFTGINNVVATYTKYKPNIFTKAEMYAFFGNITDDMSGSDKSDFYDAIKKGGYYYERSCTKDAFPDSFFIQVIKEKGDNLKIPQHVSFILNNCRIPMNNDKTLPIFSYIGKTLLKLHDMTENADLKKLTADADKLLMDEILKYLKR